MSPNNILQSYTLGKYEVMQWMNDNGFCSVEKEGEKSHHNSNIPT